MIRSVHVACGINNEQSVSIKLPTLHIFHKPRPPGLSRHLKHSLVPRPPPIFCSSVAFSIIHRSERATLNTDRRTKNGWRPGNEAKLNPPFHQKVSADTSQIPNWAYSRFLLVDNKVAE